MYLILPILSFQRNRTTTVLVQKSFEEKTKKVNQLESFRPEENSLRVNTNRKASTKNPKVSVRRKDPCSVDKKVNIKVEDDDVTIVAAFKSFEGNDTPGKIEPEHLKTALKTFGEKC